MLKNKIKNKILIFTIIFIALSVFLSGCTPTQTIYDQNTITKFVTALSNMDFNSAYSFLWEHAGCKSEESFVKDCEYIVDSLKVNDINFDNIQIEGESESEFILNYTVKLTCENAGVISSECHTPIVIENNNTFIAYTRSLLLSDFEDGDMIITTSLKGNRGEIISADGEALAENNYADTVYVIPSEIENFSSTLNSIGKIIELSEKDIKNSEKNFKTATEKSYGTSIVAVYPHNSIDEETEIQLTELKGVYVDKSSLSPQRYYPYKNIFSHTVGYANTPSSDEQIKFLNENGYSSSSVYGKEGLENAYNEQLLSKDGLRIAITNENFAVKRVLYEAPSTDGNDIILTLNTDVQSAAYYSLHDNLTTEQSGVAVVIDYKTGAVEGLSMFPSYDPNLFSFSISSDEYERLFTAEGTDQPLYPRATLGLYPPGSVIKPFIAGFALDNGIITQYSEFPYTISNNKWYPEGWRDKAITRSYDSGTPLVLKNALVKSDNIYFSWVGLKMGEDMMVSSLEKIGFASEYDFELPVSTSNILYDDTEVKDYLIADTAIGHGEVLITPLQIAALYTCFTNSGDSLKPYLVQEIYGFDESNQYNKLYSAESETLVDNVMSESSTSIIRDALRGVVTDGTAKQLDISNMKVYAKTGTAIKSNNSDLRISWVCAWSEDTEDPKLVLVMIDGPSEQDDIKFTIAKDLLK